ncbi:DUF397 domain-containing protein [Streptomyces sp. Caat 7-52]|uniref:DUF397 domain-containing protein n=1 Tax=Streptomyces sp. Caat 7-52 TaxID=2949637 RepID=UPI0020353B7C|nr:DUF397 domain-containing protein [Streptomyces sp. Caat 7-52]
MREYDLSGARRRRSTQRNGDGGNCVEVADGAPGVVPVRDSEVADGTVALAGAVVPSGPWPAPGPPPGWWSSG